MTKQNEPVKCPTPPKGEFCPVCDSMYICLQPWRKKRTRLQRMKAKREYDRLKMKPEHERG